MLVTVTIPLIILVAAIPANALQVEVEENLNPNQTESVVQIQTKDPYSPNNDNTCGQISGLSCNPLSPGGGWCCSDFVSQWNPSWKTQHLRY